MREDAFTCPACGADFSVRERLDEADGQSEQDKVDVNRAAADEAVTCPNCATPIEPSGRAVESG